jgi:hypothetical protein
MLNPAESRPALHGNVSSSGRRPDRSLRAILLLAVIALGGVWSLLPDAEEKVAGLIDDGRYASALSMLDAARAEGPLTDYQNQMLLKLYVLTIDRLSTAPLLTAVPVLQATSSEMTRRALLLFRDAEGTPAEAQVPVLVGEAAGRGQDLPAMQSSLQAALAPSNVTTSLEPSLD